MLIYGLTGKNKRGNLPGHNESFRYIFRKTERNKNTSVDLHELESTLFMEIINMASLFGIFQAFN